MTVQSVPSYPDSPSLELTVVEESWDLETNTSDVSYEYVIKRPQTLTSEVAKAWKIILNSEVVQSGSTVLGGSGTMLIAAGLKTIEHDADGNKTIECGFDQVLGFTWHGVKAKDASIRQNLTLTRIPQIPKVANTLQSVAETTAVIKWTSTEESSKLAYSTNNGSTWSSALTVSGTSGTYTISGLRPNASYNIKTRIVSVDGYTGTSSAVTAKTFAYPYATKMPDFTIGNDFTIEVYNPLQRPIRATLIGDDGSTITTKPDLITTTGTTITFDTSKSPGQRLALYESIPNSKFGDYSIAIVYSNINTDTRQGGRYTINESYCKPTISSASYADTNSATIAITENNQKIIRNLSTVRFDATGLDAFGGATIASCYVIVNGRSTTMTLNGSSASCSGVTIDSAYGVTATITATDSRGVSGSINVQVSMIDWVAPTAIITLQRKDNFYTESYITVDALYSYVDGKNTINIQFKAKRVGTSTWTISQTLTDNAQYTFQADFNYDWDVQVILTDRLGGTTTYNQVLARGTPIIFFDKELSSVGVNCFPKQDHSLEVNGIQVKRSVITRRTDIQYLSTSWQNLAMLPSYLSFNDGLTVDGDGIKIVDDITTVLVSARATVWCNNTTDGYRRMAIYRYRNSTYEWYVGAWLYVYPTANYQYIELSIPPTLVDVQKGDIIYLRATSDVNNSDSLQNDGVFTVDTLG